MFKASLSKSRCQGTIKYMPWYIPAVPFCKKEKLQIINGFMLNDSLYFFALLLLSVIAD
jgi:hypothetical protein